MGCSDEEVKEGVGDHFGANTNEVDVSNTVRVVYQQVRKEVVKSQTDVQGPRLELGICAPKAHAYVASPRSGGRSRSQVELESALFRMKREERRG